MACALRATKENNDGENGDKKKKKKKSSVCGGRNLSGMRESVFNESCMTWGGEDCKGEKMEILDQER